MVKERITHHAPDASGSQHTTEDKASEPDDGDENDPDPDVDTTTATSKKALPLGFRCDIKYVSKYNTRGIPGMEDSAQGGSKSEWGKLRESLKKFDDDYSKHAFFGYSADSEYLESDHKLIHQLEKLCRLAVQNGVDTPSELGEDLITFHFRDLRPEDVPEARKRLEKHFEYGCETARMRLDNEKDSRDAIHNTHERDIVIAMARYGIQAIGKPELRTPDYLEARDALPRRLKREILRRVHAIYLQNAKKGNKM